MLYGEPNLGAFAAFDGHEDDAIPVLPLWFEALLAGFAIVVAALVVVI